MVLQLVRDNLGNYTYKNVGDNSTNITSKDFEAYQGTQKTKLATDTTNIGTQTETLLRERPGAVKTVTDPKTGEYRTSWYSIRYAYRNWNDYYTHKSF